MIEAVLLCRATNRLRYKNVCQLEGSDHGGRDSAAELALAGTIDVQASNDSYNRLTLGSAHPTPRIILLQNDPSTGFCKRLCYAIFQPQTAELLCRGNLTICLVLRVFDTVGCDSYTANSS